MRRILAVLLGLAAPAAAQDVTDPPAADLIHADLPLFGDGTEEMWPQHFTEADGDFGCNNRVAFGTWKLHFAGKSEDRFDDRWYRFANYGVFHCFALVSDAEKRHDLKTSTSQPSFFILIARTFDRELWVLQRGARPGSDYILLSRKPDTGVIKQFEVLQRACPDALKRKSAHIDILLTDYCAVNSRGDLIELARKMAKLPPLGSLTYVDEDAGKD